MIKKISTPSIIKSAGNKPKVIEEFIGRVNSATTDVSIARMKSPLGWIEPGQRPDFNEYTLVLKGKLCIETKDATIEVNAGEAVIDPAGKWVRYSTPDGDGAEYVAVCLPAFSSETVHRDDA